MIATIPWENPNPGTVVGGAVIADVVGVSWGVEGVVWRVVAGLGMAVSEGEGVSVAGRGLVTGMAVVRVISGLSFCRRKVTSSLMVFPLAG